MKKLLLSTIIVLSALVITEAQITGGGEQQAPPPPPPTTTPVVQQTPKDTYGMFQFAYAAPGSNFQTDAGGAGVSIGISGFTPLYEIMEGFNAGLLIGGDFQVNSLDDPLIETTYVPYIFLDVLLGPSVDYQLENGIGIGAAFRLGPVIGGGPDFDIGGFDPILGFSSTTNIYNAGAAFGLGTAFALNFNFNKLVLGLEFTGGTLTYEFEEGSSGTTFEEDISIGCTRISIGSRW